MKLKTTHAVVLTSVVVIVFVLVVLLRQPFRASSTATIDYLESAAGDAKQFEEKGTVALLCDRGYVGALRRRTSVTSYHTEVVVDGKRAAVLYFENERLHSIQVIYDRLHSEKWVMLDAETLGRQIKASLP